MISATLGRSKKYNQLPDHFTKLVYIHTLTSADEQGRIEADAIAIYGDHFVIDPEANLDRIETALTELDRVGLIHLYEADGKRYAQFVDFDKHNTIRRHKDGEKAGQPLREGVSRIPAPNEGSAVSALAQDEGSAETAQQLRSDRAETAYEVKGKDKDQVEGEGEDNHTPSEERFSRAFQTGKPQANPRHRVRAELRRLAGPDFTTQHESHLDSWTRWSDTQLRDLWDASDPDRWPGEKHKKRAWILKDLLNEDRTIPRTVKHEPVGRSFQDILDEVNRDLGIN